MSVKKITGITVKLGADMSGFNDELKALDSALNKSSRELREIDKALKLDPTNTVLLTQKQQLLAQALEQSRQKLAMLESKQKEVEAGHKNGAAWEEQYRPLREELDKVNQKLTILRNKKEETDQKLANGEIDDAEYQKYNKTLEETEAKQKELINSIKALEDEFKKKGGHVSDEEYRTYQRELEQCRLETARLEQETRQLDNVTNQSSAAFRRQVESTREYRQAMDDLSKSGQEFRQKWGAALSEIWQLALKLGSALATLSIAGATAAVKTGSEFDSTMSQVKALSGAVGNEYDALRDKAIDVGEATTKSAKEAAEGLSYMALAGWNTEKSLKSLEPMVQATEASGGDLATVSDLVTDSMSALGVEVDDLTHYLDIAAQASRSSNTSMEQMFEAYVKAGNTFKNFGTSLEESSTLLGILADQGIKGSEAGNSLNSVLINLIGVSGKASEALDTMGVSAYDTDGNFKGITNTLREVSDALDGMNDKQKDTLTAQLGGKTQYDTLQALLSGINDEYDELYEKIEDSNGALQEVSEIMRDNLAGDVKLFTSALQTLGIEINDCFTDNLRDAVQAATEEVTGLTELLSDGELADDLEKISEAFAEAIKKIAEFAADKAIPGVINFFGFVADNGNTIIDTIVGIGIAFAGWKVAGLVASATKAINAYNKAVKRGATVTEALTKVLNVNPWVALAGAIAAVVAVLIKLAINASESGMKLKEAAEESLEAYEEEKDKLSDLETELENVNTQIAEIQKKGKLSFTDAEELTRLQMQSAELENQITLQEELIKLKKQQANNDTVEAITADKYQSEGTIAAVEYEIEQYENAKFLLQDAQQNLAKAQLANDENEIANWKRAAEVYEAEMQTRKQSILENIVATNELAASLDTTTKEGQETQAAVEGLNNKVIELLDIPQKNFLDAFYGDESAMNATGERYKKEALAIQKQNEELAEKSVEEQAEAAAEVKELWTQAEHDYVMGDIKSEKDLYDKKREILEKYGDESNRDYWDYYEDVYKYDKECAEKLTETQKEEYEKQIEDQVDALREKAGNSEDYTDEMFYDELETIANGLDKESDLYEQYNKEIKEGRKKLAEEMDNLTKEGQKKQLESVSSSISEIKSEYSEMLSKVTSERDSYESKLMGMADLYSYGTEKDKSGNEVPTFTLENIDNAIAAIDEYDDKLTRLEARGAGKNLVQYVQGLSKEDSENVMHVLNSMTDEELAAYSDKYDKLLQTVNDKVGARYDPQVQAINDGFVARVRELVGELPGDMSEVGLEAIDGFIKGFTGKNTELIDAVADKCNSVIDGFKDGLDINSPSKETEELGAYAGEGFEKGLEKFSGAAAAESFSEEFLAKIAEKDPDFAEAFNKLLAGNAQAAVSQMNALAAGALENVLPDIVLPDVSGLKINAPKAGSFQNGSGSDGSENNQALDEINGYLIMIINLLGKLAGKDITVKTELTDNIALTLDGNVIARAVSTKLFEEKRRMDA